VAYALAVAYLVNPVDNHHDLVVNKKAEQPLGIQPLCIEALVVAPDFVILFYSTYLPFLSCLHRFQDNCYPQDSLASQIVAIRPAVLRVGHSILSRSATHDH
jgi:hypothetical protein